MNKVRLCSIFVLLALLIGFIGASPAKADLADHPWMGYGTGTTTVVSDGENSPAQFTYDSWGTYSGSWTFETTAVADGVQTLYWNYQGLHAWYAVTVQLSAFITHAGTTTPISLINAGPENCCTPPSNGFNYYGTYTFNVQQGDIYGFMMSGSNFDYNWLLRGTLTVDDQFIHNDLFYFDGSYYEIFYIPYPSWESARDFANAIELEGCFASHLVTITSQEEQDALYGHFGNNLEYKWYGGYQPVVDPSMDPRQGWVWVTDEEWVYTNWGTGQPDDWMGGEHYLAGWYNNSWNDENNVFGFVVEYECNLPPLASAGGPYLGDEGSPISLDGSGSSDPDGDLLTYAWTVAPDLCIFDNASVASPNLTCPDNGDFIVTLAVNDGEYTSEATAAVTTNNVAPASSIDSITPALVAIGTQISAAGSFIDPGASDTFSALWDWGDGNTSAGSLFGLAVGPDQHAYAEAGIYTVQLAVTDDDGGSGSAAYQYVVVYDPTAGFVTGGGWIDSPDGALRLVTDLPFFGGHYYQRFGDNATWAEANEAANASSLEGCASVHLATITSMEEQDAIHAAFGNDIAFAWLGGYREDNGWQWVTGEPWEYTNWQPGEPSGEDVATALHVGGGGVPIPDGWIYDGKWDDTDPTWNYPYIVEYQDCGPTGKATFGFVSKYQKGTSVPTGNTEFQFRVAGFNFHSTSYEWLVVTGSNFAKFKGEGTINGEGIYKFMIWAGDGTGEGGTDTFRIKIWTEENGVETVVYDNGMNQAISGGSIIVHSN